MDRITGTPDLDAGAEISRIFNEIMGPVRDPRSRYFEHRGWQYGWTTERMGDGRYAAFIYKPVGKGARSGKARQMQLIRERHYTQRSTAKRNAERWYETAVRRSAK